jgi:hypothetical protein
MDWLSLPQARRCRSGYPVASAGLLRLRCRRDGIPAQLVTLHFEVQLLDHFGAKADRRRLWLSLGICLPRQVIPADLEMAVPRCTAVERY